MVVAEDLDKYRKLLRVKPDASLDELRAAYNELLECMEKKLEKVTGFTAREQMMKTVSEARAAYFFLIRAAMHPELEARKTETHWQTDPAHKVRRQISRSIIEISKNRQLALPEAKKPALLCPFRAATKSS